MIRVRRASSLLAGRQGGWIASMEPWVGLGYSAAALAKFLRRAGTAGQVWVASGGALDAPPLGVVVLQPGFLLGNFVSLLAVRPQAARQGVGRALMGHVERVTFVNRRWLFTSADTGNRGALSFYRTLGFKRVGMLPDLVRDGRTEVLLRKRSTR